MSAKRCVILGAGLMGRLMAFALARAGHRIEVHEALGPDATGAAARVAAARADLGDSLTGTKGANIRPAGEFRQPLPAGVRRVANQTYHSPKEGNVLLDLLLPEKKPAAPLPVVVWVHGGGWSKGSKENPPLAWLAAEGYAVASINYRLSWIARWPAQIDDVRAAVRWLRANAAPRVRPNRVSESARANRAAVPAGSSEGSTAGAEQAGGAWASNASGRPTTACDLPRWCGI